MAIVSWVRVCRDGGGVRTLWNQLAAGSNDMHEVSRDLLFTTKLIRVWGEVILTCLSIPACVGLAPPWESDAGKIT